MSLRYVSYVGAEPPLNLPVLASLIAMAFLGGEQIAEEAGARAQQAMGHAWPSLVHLARRYLRRFRQGPRPRHEEVREFIENDRGFQVALRSYLKRPTVRTWTVAEPLMQPVAAAAGWALPGISTEGALADWLGLDPADLLWFADLRSLERKRQTGPLLRHYTYHLVQKPDGRVRLIEAPKTRLKQMQRQILREILDRVPVHPAAHGFVSQRSIKTFAEPHAGQRVVVKMDLDNFFPSLRRARIQAMFRTFGYPEAVADSLSGLCTNWTPHDVWRGTAAPFAVRQLYARPHLPQGAPTSPALANLCAYHLDCRLTGLAESAGAVYTRYADDLAFSGDDRFRHASASFLRLASEIVGDEGFTVNARKTRLMPASTRQQLAGLVTNARPNMKRAEFDELKATLTNCLRHGPESQNREGHSDFRAHLAGRIAFCAMVNPEKAQRLQAIFERVYS